MDIDEFLEKDIIHFLEQRKEKPTANADREEDYGLYLTKDYLKEAANYLNRDELIEAQKLFDELRLHYNSLPKESLESKKVYSMLEQMYTKIDIYLKLRSASEKIRPFSDLLLGQPMYSEGITPPIMPAQLVAMAGSGSIEKKIDRLDKKITEYGQDVKEVKFSLLRVPKSKTDILVDKKSTIEEKRPEEKKTEPIPITLLPKDPPRIPLINPFSDTGKDAPKDITLQDDTKTISDYHQPGHTKEKL